MQIVDAPLKISVITVCFNSEATLERTLSSVAAQDWPHVEHIVVDGASTDGTLEILERFHSRLSCVLSEPDNGIYDAMNKGIQKATGDVVCFLNSDDQYMHAGVLSLVARHMHDLAAIFGDVVFFKKDEPERIVRYYRSKSFHPDRLAWGWMPAHPSLFVRREICKRLGGFKPTYRIAGDFEFVARLFTVRSIRYNYLPEALVKMQLGGASTAPGFKGRILHNKELLRACRENSIPTNLIKILIRYPRKLCEWFYPQ